MLLGRDQEQLALVRLLQDARSGRSGVLAIVGEAGIGKSALLDYAAEHAGGMNVLRARGVQSEAHIPFAGLFELLRPALGAVDQIPGPQAAALESALALRPGRAQDRFTVGAATLSLLAPTRTRPRSRSCSTTRTGSTGQARMPCSSRSAAWSPIRSR